MVLTKAAILAAADIQTREVCVPEWGGSVMVRGLDGAGRDKYDSQIIGEDGKADLANARASLVAMSVVDEDGKLLFTADDVAALGAKSAAALERVVSVAQELSGLVEPADKKK